MKIGMNTIGNYSPTALRQRSEPQKFGVEAKAEIKNSSAVKNEPAISQEEKNFFAGLYPGNEKEIIDYHFYEKSGKMSGVRLGSQIDRRG